MSFSQVPDEASADADAVAVRAVRCEQASYVLVFFALVMTLYVGLLAALFSGFLVYSLIHLVAPLLAKISGKRSRVVAAAAIGIIVLCSVGLLLWGAIVFFRSDAGNLQHLLRKLADIIEASRDRVPESLKDSLPVDADALGAKLSAWLRLHAGEAKNIGVEAGRTLAHVFIGMVIGMLASLHDSALSPFAGPLSRALASRLARLSDAFRRVVFAQARISAINTTLTAIFLFVVLPLADVQLPLAKTIVVVTFIAGLLPVIGNLISNSVLVTIALSQSFETGVAALVFMMLLHESEYFLNARIIGAQINAKVWELLLAMLVMESLCGIPGVIAAPVFYAYLKAELTAAQLI